MEKQLNEQEALLVIRGMIEQAKTGIKEKGTLYLLWGWLVFIAALAHYALMKYTSFQYPFVPWFGMMLIGFPASIYFGIKEKKTAQTSTYLDSFMGYLWTAMGVSLFITLFSMQYLQLGTYPVILIIYGIATFVSGGALKFKPLILGGCVCWILSVVCLYVGEHYGFEYQLLILAVAVLAAYIIPGHLLKARA